MALPLISGADNSEIIRSQIGSILITEIARQHGLAQDAAGAYEYYSMAGEVEALCGQNEIQFGNHVSFRDGPTDWEIDVFVERSNPWDATKIEAGRRKPIVNIWWEKSSQIEGESNTIEKQTFEGTFNIDCYGFGKSEKIDAVSHTAGDQLAVYEAQRTVRLIRRILMAGPNAYLGMQKNDDNRQVVKGREVSEIVNFQPQQGERPIEHAYGARIVFLVQYNEYSPQFVAETLDSLSIDVVHGDTDRVVPLIYT